MKSLLEQFMTPEWVGELVVEKFFPSLGPDDLVIEPSCGRGAILKAIPPQVPAVGVEIDPALAAEARFNTGRTILEGDFVSCPIPGQPTAIVGNPPFRVRTVRAFLERAWELLPEEGRCGFILPVETFQHTHTLLELSEKWSIAQHMLPRDLWGRMLRRNILFAEFIKDRRRGLVGFALYPECHDVKHGIRKDLQALLIQGKPHRSAWRGLVENILADAGGRASLQTIYERASKKRPTENPWWKEKIRQVLQAGPFIQQDGVWALT